MKKRLVLVVLMAMMVLTTLNAAIAAEGFDATAAEEEGYWYSRYNMGTLAMKSGLGETFMPDMQAMQMAMQMVDADLDPGRMDTDYGDGDHPVPPTNPALLQAVYKSGDPHYTQMMNLDDIATQTWDPATFDKTLTGLSQGFLMVKEIEWGRQFHVDEHFGTPSDNFGAQWRFVGMVIVMEAKMQAQYFLQNKDKFDLSNGGDYVMLWALSDLADLTSTNALAHSSSNRYKDDMASKMFGDGADMVYNDLKGRTPVTLKDKSLAIQALVWYAKATKDADNKADALLKIKELSGKLAKMTPKDAAETAYAIRGLVEAKRVVGADIPEIPDLAETLFNDFDDATGKFTSQNTYTIDDVGAIIGALNALNHFEGANVDLDRSEEVFKTFYETVMNKAGLQQSAPPLTVGKSPFEYEDEPEIYFRYPDLPMPPMAGGDYGIAPVFATSVTYDNGQWTVSDARFDSAGAMHASNEMIWLHYDEINGFPNVDVTTAISSLKTSRDKALADVAAKESELANAKSSLSNAEGQTKAAQDSLAAANSKLSETEKELEDTKQSLDTALTQANQPPEGASNTTTAIVAIVALLIGAVVGRALKK